MTILAIDWGYALLVTGMGIGTVFLLLIVLIWVIGLQNHQWHHRPLERGF